MVAVLYIPVVRIFDAVCFFQSDYCWAFLSFVAEKRFCALHVSAQGWFKKEVTNANKILKLNFFLITV